MLNCIIFANMQRRFIFLYNPISGTGNKEQLLAHIESRCKKEQVAYSIEPTNAAGNYHYLRQQIAEQGITHIIVCGGDGTVNQVAAALLQLSVYIGIIPMGSGNGLAFAAGIPKKISRALDIVFTGKAIATDGFYINGHFSCMLCGLGFDAQVAHNFARQKKRGLATYARQTIKHFLQARPYPFKISFQNIHIQTEAFFISIANSNQFGNHVTIAPRASISDGLLDVVIVKKMSKAKMLFALLRQIKMGQITPTEAKFKKEDILYYQTPQLSIHNLANAPLHIDGDPAATDTFFDIKIVPAAFLLLQP